MNTVRDYFMIYVNPYLWWIVVGLAILGIICLVFTIKKKDWGTGLQMSLSILLVIFGGLLTIPGASVQPPYHLPLPELVVTDSIESLPTGESLLDTYVLAENRGTVTATGCKAKALIDDKKYHLAMPSEINGNDFAKIVVVRAQKGNDRAWSTWLYTEENARVIDAGWALNASWALQPGTYTLKLSITCQQTESEAQQFTLVISRDTSPKLTTP